MSGVIANNLDKSGTIEGGIRNEATLQAFCKVNSNSPSSGQFANHFNVSSISYGSTSVTINFRRNIDYPATMMTNYNWSTGTSWHVIGSGISNNPNQSNIAPFYRKVAQGATSTDPGVLNNALLIVYGGQP